MEKHELVDTNGIGPGLVLTENEAHILAKIPEGYYMPIVGVVIVNNKNEVLLQKRSRFKKINPNKWGICGGKVNINETTTQAGFRETFEEIGIKIDEKKLNILRQAAHNKAYFTVYYIKQDVDISECKLQKEEVEKLKYFKIDELENLDNEGFEWLDNLKEILKKQD